MTEYRYFVIVIASDKTQNFFLEWLYLLTKNDLNLSIFKHSTKTTGSLALKVVNNKG